MHKKYLEYIGLSDKESEVYIALLRVDTMPAIDIARKTGFKKSNVYLILDELVRRELVRVIMIGKREHYRAESPNILRAIVDQKKATLEREIAHIETIIMELKSLERDLGERPVIRLYEGREAVKRAIDEYVSAEDFSDGKDYGIYSYDVMSKLFSEKDIQTIDEKRIEHNIRFKAIYSGEHKVIDGSRIQERIKIDQERFPLLADIGIFNDEIRFHTLGSKSYGVFIKNKEIATTLKSLIEYVFALQENK